MTKSQIKPEAAKTPKKKATTSAVARVKKAPAPKKSEVVKRDSMLSIVGTVTTDQLKQALSLQTEQRKLIKEFINEHLKEGTDYGKIHVVKNCRAEDQKKGSCDTAYHYSKPILFKPGQEKIFSLFSITDELSKDEDAYQMLTEVKGLVAYKCIMYQRGNRIGEGRGAASLGSERSDPNSTIKKAEKRARMDACLSLGFSEYFTQDLDDPEYASQREMANSRTAAEAERRDKDEFGLMPRDPAAPIDNYERAALHREILKAGFAEDDEILELLRTNGIQDPQSMTSGQAREMMSKIRHGMFSKPPEPAKSTEPVYTKDNSQESPDDFAQVSPEADMPDLEVNDDMRRYVQEQVSNMQLNSRGTMWFKRLCGAAVYVEWDKFTDDQWRKAYDAVERWINLDLTIDLEYIKDEAEVRNRPDLATPPAEENDESKAADDQPAESEK